MKKMYLDMDWFGHVCDWLNQQLFITILTEEALTKYEL